MNKAVFDIELKHCMPLMLSFFLVAGIVSSCRSSEQIKIDGTGWSILVPPGWTWDTTGLSGTSLVLASPGVDENDSFYENINLSIVPLADPALSLTDFLNENLETMKTYLPEWELESRESLSWDGSPAVALVYTGELDVYSMRWKQWYTLRDGKAWVLTLAAEQRHYDAVSGIAEQVYHNFRWR